MRMTGRLRVLVVGLVVVLATAVGLAVVNFGSSGDAAVEAAPAPVVLTETVTPVATPTPPGSPDATNEATAEQGRSAGDGMSPTATVTVTPMPTPSPSATPGSGNLITNALEGLREGAGTLIAGAIPDWSGTERVTFLLLGTDRRPGEEASRSDTIMVFSVDPGTSSMALISIPRDLCVEKCKTARDRVNGIFLREGPVKMAEAVGELLGVEIDYYVTIGFEGFEEIVDTLGGIEIEVYQEFDDNFLVAGSEEGVRLKLEVGVNRLDGPTALMYARSRLANQRSDWDRICRQQQVLLAVKAQVLTARAFVLAPSLIRTLVTAVETDFPVTEIPPMAKLILAIAPEHTVLRVVDHGSGTILGHEGEDGAEMLKPDPEKLIEFVQDIFDQAAVGHGVYGGADGIEFTTGRCG